MVKRFLYLNGLAILAAVLNHASGWGMVALFWWTDRYRSVAVPNFDALGSPNYFGLRMVEQYIIYAIPTFLFVSGFFAAFATNRNQKTISWKVVLNRVKNLAIPYLLWTFLILGANMMQGQSYTPSTVLEYVLVGGAAPPFYFVPVLIQFYLLSPLLVPLARSRWKLLLVAAALIQLSIMLMRYAFILAPDNPVLQPFYGLVRAVYFPAHIFWFSSGMVIGFHLPKLKQTLVRGRWVFLISTVVFYGLGILEWEVLLRNSGQQWISPKETLIDHLYAASFILAFLAFDKFTPAFSEQLATLGSKSYGIYLMHHPVQEYTARLVYHVVPGLLANQLLFQPLLILMGLSVPLIVMGFMNRSPARRFYEYVFG
ncbi:MAG TPA: acyltransferase [Anaerolineales bacterium]|nr:acyltransferase [Anaerolineales bacterium]